jgi:copper(I)-binding protein
MRLRRGWTVVASGAVVCLLADGAVARAMAQEKQPAMSSGWVKTPAAGATSTEAYATVENPTMYAFYLLSATSDVAGTVELRQAGKDAPLEEVTVPAYGSLDMDPKGYYLVLKDLKKPLAEGDTVNVTVVTELGVKLSVQATVKKP